MASSRLLGGERGEPAYQIPTGRLASLSHDTVGGEDNEDLLDGHGVQNEEMRFCTMREEAGYDVRVELERIDGTWGLEGALFIHFKTLEVALVQDATHRLHEGSIWKCSNPARP